MRRKVLFAAAAVASLALTGCGQGPANLSARLSLNPYTRRPVHPVAMLESDPSTKTATLIVDAGYNSTNDWANYNGYANGQMTVTIPLGYRVNIEFTNDAGIPYDIGVYTENRQLAFPGAGSSVQELADNASAGVMPGESETLSFTAARTGNFRMESLLYRFPNNSPARTSMGMWAAFNVVPSGNPSVTV